MSLHVERGELNSEHGCFEYLVWLKPVVDLHDAVQEIAVDVLVSIAENGDLTRLSFVAPNSIQSPRAFNFLEREEKVTISAGKIVIQTSELAGDTIFTAPGRLEIDSLGRILGVEVNWPSA